MSEPTSDTTVNVQGDAVVNQAPDGGGVDNNAGPATAPQPAFSDDAKTKPGDTETSV